MEQSEKIVALAGNLQTELEAISRYDQEQADGDLFNLGLPPATPERRYAGALETLAVLKDEIEKVQEDLAHRWLLDGGAVKTLARVGGMNRGTLLRRKSLLDSES